MSPLGSLNPQSGQGLKILHGFESQPLLLGPPDNGLPQGMFRTLLHGGRQGQDLLRLLSGRGFNIGNR